MAFISTEEVKQIRQNIKKLYPAKKGWKFSITRRHGSEICIAILQGPHNFELEANGKNRSINHFHIDSHCNGSDAKILNSIMKLIHGEKSNYNSNAGDPGADYPAWNYFISLEIGQWDKPYKLA